MRPQYPPPDVQDFFGWLRAASEEFWANLTIDPAAYGFQIRAGTRWLPGLPDDAIAAYEGELGFRFPAVYKQFLQAMNGTDRLAINVYGECGEPYAYWPAYYAFPRDLELVKEGITWIYGEFGVTAAAVASRGIPHILPITGHRYLVADNCGSNPVLSMMGRDTILYAPSLQEFLVNDIFFEHRWCGGGEDPPDVPFWLDEWEPTAPPN